MIRSESKTEKKRKPTAVDLFCGCGGLTLGLKQAGFRVIGAVDNDPLSVATYKANHSKVKVYLEDIQNMNTNKIAEELRVDKNKLDLLAGCPPCQGFSTMRTLNGALNINDPRNNLLLEFLRFVETFLPRAVMLENVPGLAHDNRFVSFCEKMKLLGYVGEYKILNAAKYSVPQRRHRLIYMAGFGFGIPFANTVDKRLT